ncbi:MAG TPA: F0F1 ATP synthase subunit delta [Candidatus Paceibacterota bacterium]|nr:F0F1 ATP synthase subunit delta [Candidatus Paceibacterota bacterium]
MIDTYTRLLEAAAETGSAEVAQVAVTKLMMHLQSSGRVNMLPQIVRELRKVAAYRHTLRPRVEVASQKEAPEALSAAAEFGIHAPEATINPSLIRGWRAQENGRLIDHSAKHALAHIYQKVTV